MQLFTIPVAEVPSRDTPQNNFDTPAMARLFGIWLLHNIVL